MFLKGSFPRFQMCVMLIGFFSSAKCLMCFADWEGMLLMTMEVFDFQLIVFTPVLKRS
ncbi:AGAP004836-PA [Anopheles gambiae str. PEST]|uniref:AGAP004836-PA n=1 Tax=Anopheles gambiae TaxID=7165 RepID=Q52P93_ANOGA|nr:hyp3.5 precursor [Anopheles gambiae]EAU76788.1 AGAP004836-PA [Anopheles gambiae str. PEST]